jgi:tRNA G18 (ribose-2'-O)-methylase SpoU
MPEIVLIVHNIRSIHNVGSIFRTAEGFGISKIYLSGYTPSPDSGLPHVRAKIAEQLHKTALGAEDLIKFSYHKNINALIDTLKKSGYQLVGLEQDERAIKLPNYKPTGKVALLLGEEVHGITQQLRDLCDELIEIPMNGQKESFNVAVATGIALYHLTTTASAP